jgi:hypothetical protein
MSFDLYQWHSRGECQRWKKIPAPLRKQPKLGDILWLLVRLPSSSHVVLTVRVLDVEQKFLWGLFHH